MSQNNLRNPVYFGVEGLEVASWSSGADDEGIPATQVHLIYKVKELEMTFVLRLKSRVVCDDLITALIEHRDFVFGTPDAAEKAAERKLGK